MDPVSGPGQEDLRTKLRVTRLELNRVTALLSSVLGKRREDSERFGVLLAEWSAQGHQWELERAMFEEKLLFVQEMVASGKSTVLNDVLRDFRRPSPSSPRDRAVGHSNPDESRTQERGEGGPGENANQTRTLSHVPVYGNDERMPYPDVSTVLSPPDSAHVQALERAIERSSRERALWSTQQHNYEESLRAARLEASELRIAVERLMGEVEGLNGLELNGASVSTGELLKDMDSTALPPMMSAPLLDEQWYAEGATLESLRRALEKQAGALLEANRYVELYRRQLVKTQERAVQSFAAEEMIRALQNRLQSEVRSRQVVEEELSQTERGMQVYAKGVADKAVKRASEYEQQIIGEQIEQIRLAFRSKPSSPAPTIPQLQTADRHCLSIVSPGPTRSRQGIRPKSAGQVFVSKKPAEGPSLEKAASGSIYHPVRRRSPEEGGSASKPSTSTPKSPRVNEGPGMGKASEQIALRPFGSANKDQRRSLSPTSRGRASVSPTPGRGKDGGSATYTPRPVSGTVKTNLGGGGAEQARNTPSLTHRHSTEDKDPVKAVPAPVLLPNSKPKRPKSSSSITRRYMQRKLQDVQVPDGAGNRAPGTGALYISRGP